MQFEYGPTPQKDYTADNSAFDVAIQVEAKNRSGLIGIECKYTDPFSPTEYDTTRYRDIFTKSNQRYQRFSNTYNEYITKSYNQLFRNQLIAEALLQKHEYDFVKTALFCHPEDEMAKKTGKEFQSMLNGGEEMFKVITYADFIVNLQQLPTLSWEQREFCMLLWVRYCGERLSKDVYEYYQEHAKTEE